MKAYLFKTILFIAFSWHSVLLLSSESNISIIPSPAGIQIGNGLFYLSCNTQLLVEDARFMDEIFYFQNFIKSVQGQYLSLSEGENRIVIRECSECTESEGYKLDITSNEITLSANNKQGLFYAIQTLKQLILTNKQKDIISLPTLSIYDYPSYPWRGMMLDVSRHFFTIEYLKRQIDLLALYKFNKFHLHLTDDQGWRVEIKQYPELTQKGAWRTFNRQDSTCIRRSKENPDFEIDPRFIVSHEGNTLYGGYYTQEEIKDLIRYASERHIEIIPEIDMPGHMMAAISAYPELACTGEAGWGELFSIPVCPCNEQVYVFMENILLEIATLFPSKYIHIGADEVEKTTWATSPACKELMAKEGFTEVEELQSYFVERIQHFLKSKGKEVIVWDDALEGGINSDFHVMYWRDWIGGIPQQSVNNGNMTIFSPGYPLYLSRADSSFYDVYHMKAFANAVSEDKKNMIAGGQANIWTEGIPSENRANYLIYPRLIALSEIVWTPADKQNWTSFKERLNGQLNYLDAIGVKHSQPSYTLIPSMNVDTVKKEIHFTFESEKVHPDIYYTTDGKIPTLRSKKYDTSISVSKSAEVCAAIYAEGKMQEPVFRRKADYHKAIGKPVNYILPWNKSYPANEDKTLTDGYRGGERYNDGYWQGFTTDVDVVIDMEEVVELNTFSATFMQITGPGVYMPEYVEVSLSDDGHNFRNILMLKNDVGEDVKELTFKAFQGHLKKEKARYIKLYAKNKSPERFLFVDEIVIY